MVESAARRNPILMNGSEILISLRSGETSSHVLRGSVKIASGRPDFAVSVYDVGAVAPMRSVMRKMENGVVRDTFMYEVDLPFDETIQIIHHGNRGTGYQYCWQVRRIKGGVCGEWAGKFASAEEAALQSA